MRTRRSGRILRAAAAVFAVVAFGAPMTGCDTDDGDDSTSADSAPSDVDGATTTVGGTSGTDAPDGPPATTTAPPPTTEPATTRPTEPAPPPPTEPAPDTTPDPTGPTTTAAPEPSAETRANVYWAWTVLGDQVQSPERIAAGARTVGADAPTRHALEALIAGPNAIETEIGMLSTIPAGTQVLGISADGTTATVDLSGEFESSAGSLEERFRLAQVVYTVTQFDEFDRVKFNIDGEPRDVIMSHGTDVGDGLTRGDFESIRALILIEDPAPGEAVGNPLVVRGEANTFEATIDYALTGGGGDGIIITEGFTTGGGFGEWLPFELAIDLDDFPDTYLAGPGAIIMWESSPIDGTQQHIVEIPIILPEI